MRYCIFFVFRAFTLIFNEPLNDLYTFFYLIIPIGYIDEIRLLVSGTPYINVYTRRLVQARLARN